MKEIKILWREKRRVFREYKQKCLLLTSNPENIIKNFYGEVNWINWKNFLVDLPFFIQNFSIKKLKNLPMKTEYLPSI